MESALALVHSRFSTNTFPSWERAHPYRYLAHNGEINTLRGNINWMHARQALFQSELFGDDIKKILPIINPNGSDSAMFDNTLELLVLAGRPLPHAVMMMIPEPWSNHETMDDDRRAFYQYHSCLMEPWDGPASIAFTDGNCQIGAVLDRNGLRPSRYYVTKDGLVIMASEAGVLDIDRRGTWSARAASSRAACSWWTPPRAASSRTRRSSARSAAPALPRVAQRAPRAPRDLPEAPKIEPPLTTRRCSSARSPSATPSRTSASSSPHGQDGVEATAPWATTPRSPCSPTSRACSTSYFKQLFAQVTNPPIDSIREEIVTSAETRLGSEGNLLNPEPPACRRVELKWPILTNEEFAKIRRTDLPGLKTGVLPILFRVTRGEKGLAKSMEELCVMARRMIEEEEVNVIILSDRGVTPRLRPHPGAVRRRRPAPLPDPRGPAHPRLPRARNRRGPRGPPLRAAHRLRRSAINPYVAFETIDDMIREGLLTGIDHKKACKPTS
jgi:glutamate synthase (NADPH/NADH) large chain